MIFTLKKKTLLVASLLLTATSYGSTIASSNTIAINTTPNTSNNLSNNNALLIKSEEKNAGKTIVLKPINIITDEKQALGDITKSITGLSYISTKDTQDNDRSYGRFHNEVTLDYITKLLDYFQNDSDSFLNQDIFKKKKSINFIETSKNIKDTDLMKFSLIFQTMLENNLNEKTHKIMRKYDRFEIFRIFSGINKSVKDRIDKSSYRVLLTDNFLQMIVAQFFEIAVGGKFKDNNGVIEITPTMDKLCKKVNNIEELKEKMEFIKNNSDILHYNTDTLIKILQNNNTLKDKQEYVDEINNIYTQKDIQANKDAVGSWNEIIDLINNGKEEIDAEYGTDAYYKEYRKKNPLMKTIFQSINLFNTVFNEDNTDNNNKELTNIYWIHE